MAVVVLEVAVVALVAPEVVAAVVVRAAAAAAVEVVEVATRIQRRLASTPAPSGR